MGWWMIPHKASWHISLSSQYHPHHLPRMAGEYVCARPMARPRELSQVKPGRVRLYHAQSPSLHPVRTTNSYTCYGTCHVC